MRRELPVIACSLDAAGQADRGREFADLFAGARIRREGPARAVATLDAAREPDVRALLAREAECCPFWTFTVARDGDTLTVAIAGPDDAAALLDRLLPA